MTFPPENFEQLRLVPYKIKHGELDLPIGRKILNALFYMIENPGVVAVSNIVEISKMVNICPASITRLSKLLGFTGFNPFHSIFKQANTEPNHYYSDKLKSLMRNRPDNSKVFLRNQAHAVSSSLNSLVESLHIEDFEQAARLLVSQKRVYFFGYRQPSALAGIFRYGLTLLRSNVHMLSQADHGLALAIKQLRKEDLLILVSSSPYSEVTIKVASQSRDSGCKLLVVTDSVASPLSDYADVSLTIPPNEHFYVNSQILNCFFVGKLIEPCSDFVGSNRIR